MTDFQPLLARLVAGLPKQTAASRRSVHDRARAALRAVLERGSPPAGPAEIAAELARLESAIARIEAGYVADGSPATSDDAAARPTEGRPGNEHRQFAYNAVAGAIANLAKIAMQIVLLPLMARLVGPAEFGLYALALPAIVFFTTLADGGLGASLAREREASTAVWSTAFWALLASCTVLALLTIGGGFVLADLAGQPRLVGLMALLALSFPLLALTALPAARLVRRGNLVVHSIADVVATLVGAVAAVALAWAGAGAWAMAVQYVLAWTVCCLVLNAAAFERPSLEFRPAALKRHLATGSALIGSRLCELVGWQAENLLFGRAFGATALGSYTFANQASRFLCEAAGNPLWGALYSHALRREPQEIEVLHGTMSRLLASAVFPASALLAGATPQIFAAVLGPRWADAAVLVQILVPFYALNVVAAQCGAVLLANGRNASLFWVAAGLSAGRILALLAGCWAGPVGVAWGIDAANAAYAVAMFAVVGSRRRTGTWPLIRALLPPMVASILGGAVCHALLAARPESPSWTIVCLTSGGCTFLSGLLLLQGRRLIADAAALRRIVFARR